MKSPLKVAVGRIAAATRSGDADEMQAAREALMSARLEREIDNAVSPEEPIKPLRMTERSRLAMRLLGNEDML